MVEEFLKSKGYDIKQIKCYHINVEYKRNGKPDIEHPNWGRIYDIDIERLLCDWVDYYYQNKKK